jgi:hypothetical protein
MTNKYLEKIALFRPKRQPLTKFKKEEFQGRFTEMFDKAVKGRKLNAEKVKNYRWKNSIGMVNKEGLLSRLLVPSKANPGKHLELKHPDYKKK